MAMVAVVVGHMSRSAALAGAGTGDAAGAAGEKAVDTADGVVVAAGRTAGITAVEAAAAGSADADSHTFDGWIDRCYLAILSELFDSTTLELWRCYEPEISM